MRKRPLLKRIEVQVALADLALKLSLEKADACV
jgi:hypothetical protein